MPRKKQDEEEAPEEELQEEEGSEEEQDQDEEFSDEEQVEEEAEDRFGGLSLQINEDSVTIELPRDGNEKKTLDGIGKLLDGME